MGETIIPRKVTNKYFCISITEKWSFIPHLSNSLKKVAGIAGAMNSLLKKKKLLASNTKTAFYKTAIRPVIGYGFPLWSAISSHQMERLRRAERRFIRWSRSDCGRVPGSHRFVNSKWIYNEAGVRHLGARLIDVYIRQMDRIETSTNPLVASMFSVEKVARCQRREKHQPPEASFHLNEANPLIDDLGRTFHYNRRIRDGVLIYVIEQGSKDALGNPPVRRRFASGPWQRSETHAHRIATMGW